MEIRPCLIEEAKRHFEDLAPGAEVIYNRVMFAVALVDGEMLIGCALVVKAIEEIEIPHLLLVAEAVVKEGVSKTVCLAALLNGCSRVARAMGANRLLMGLPPGESGNFLRFAGWHNLGDPGIEGKEVDIWCADFGTWPHLGAE